MNNITTSAIKSKAASVFMKLFILTLVFMGTFSLQSCSDDDGDSIIGPVNGQYDQTIIMYLPWALYLDGKEYKPFYDYYFKTNIDELERAIVENHGTNNKAIYVFVCQSETRSALVKFNYHRNGRIDRDTVEIYNTPATHFITSDGIKSVINTIKSKDKSKSYGMIFGCHGQGWMPVGKEPYHDSSARPEETAVMPSNTTVSSQAYSRWIGSGDAKYQISTKDLAYTIKSVNITLDFILFDACYMANIETAYELKDVAHYLIASPNETKLNGVPYRSAGISLLNNSYKGVCDDFYNFYENQQGSLSVTDLTKVEQMAAFFKSIRNKYEPVSEETSKTIQTMDGYAPIAYFDLGDYADKYITDENDLKRFRQLLDELVVYERHTECLFTALPGKYQNMNGYDTIKMHTFSGLTISEPTRNQPVIDCFPECQWYIDTFPMN